MYIPVVKLSASNYKKVRGTFGAVRRYTHTRIPTRARKKMVIIHILELMNFAVSVPAREREGLAAVYTKIRVWMYTEEKKVRGGTSDKSGRESPRARVYPTLFSGPRPSREPLALSLCPPPAIATDCLTFLLLPRPARRRVF